MGAVVCIAAANAGGTSQDLKTGYLVGVDRDDITTVGGASPGALVAGGPALFLAGQYFTLGMALAARQS